MASILVIHWDPEDGRVLCDRIRRDGFEVSLYAHRGPSGFRALAADPPGAIVIDLMRMPSYGRVMGALLRERKSTRSLPLVFVAGDPEKTAVVKATLPDAIFTDLARIGPALRRATKRGAAEGSLPVAPQTSIHQKLKIGKSSVVALLHAPDGLETRLAPLPEGARLQTVLDGADVALVFVRSAATLSRELPELAGKIQKGRTLWLVWPKKAGSGGGKLTMPAIRQMCVDVGLIDYKVCAVDETWSAMAISMRRK